MRQTNFFYYMVLAFVMSSLMFCGDGANDKDGTATDATGITNDTSSHAAHVDPSTAYPQPPVTGSNQDSSRTTDSVNHSASKDSMQRHR
jgi:hypothetical protein